MILQPIESFTVVAARDAMFMEYQVDLDHETTLLMIQRDEQDKHHGFEDANIMLSSSSKLKNLGGDHLH